MSIELAKVEAMCSCCTQGFVYHPLTNPCFRCGSKVIAIEPIPNVYPYTAGHFVEQLADGTRPSRKS